MFVAPFIVLFLILMTGTVIFLVIWTINRARKRGAAQVLKTVGMWTLAGLLIVLAGGAYNFAFGRSPVSASASGLTGTWTNESSEGTATIGLRSDGSAFVNGIPSAAAWEVGFGADDLGLPPLLSGEGTWDVSSHIRVKLTCDSGQPITLLADAVEGATGSTYLQFMAGDPDAPTYFREFSRVDSSSGAHREEVTEPSC
ncbi:hypothetical protein [Agromyces sp. CCNWLW203]|uniref:hypothetical protein n=1 Tax=Agromyces sp. CCNWLW203 TaxID=3112842 RepID=UPI002F965C08